MEEKKFPDEWLLYPDTNRYIKPLLKWEYMNFFPTVVENDSGWSVWFKFWDFHFHVQLAWAPKPVLHDFFVDSWMSHEDASFLLKQLKIGMLKEKTVTWSNGKPQKRSAIRVNVKRIFDENDLK